jgi:hypothetical protein
VDPHFETLSCNNKAELRAAFAYLINQPRYLRTNSVSAAVVVASSLPVEYLITRASAHRSSEIVNFSHDRQGELERLIDWPI